MSLEARIEQLVSRGVTVVDPRQTFLDGDVDPQRIWPGAVLHPGTRLHGSRTLLAPGAEVGTHGPATVIDGVFGPGAQVASGYVEGAVLLDGASLGPNAHVRPGTLLEEQASTAHAVGLKHTILLSFVTVGSVVNFCDVLMAGGTSRRDHSEVGSGFIHFNFTPWGEHGDKATPSLVGNVVDGVLLRSPRIFLGGTAGMIGPRTVGFGSVAAAGQVLREDVPAGRIVSRSAPNREVSFQALRRAPRTGDRIARNLAYIGQLHALLAWYRAFRLRRAEGSADPNVAAYSGEIVRAAIGTLEVCVQERVNRLQKFCGEAGVELVTVPAFEPADLPIEIDPAATSTPHVEFVQSLPDGSVERLSAWLENVAGRVAPTPAETRLKGA